MKKITKANIEELANEIIDFLHKEKLSSDVSIYFNNKVIKEKGSWDNESNYITKWETTENVNPHDYFEYCAYDHILSMSFEGGLYELLNYSGGSRMGKFEKIFEKYGLYYELGNAWNLSCYLINDDIEVEYTYYEKPKKKIYLHNGNFLNPRDLQNIMDVWYDLSKKEGDIGSCVLGAGFGFEWKGEKYFMPAQSPWQGSCSWEAHKDVIHKMLEDVGATEISYAWGIMD
jgi:hypothetical protein